MSKTIELAKHLEKLHINNMYKSDFYWTWDKTDEELEAIFTVADALRDLPNVEAELWPGLLADFAVRHHASAIVRGVRNTTDFDVEYQMALINRGIHPELETLLLPASAAYQHFSSSMAREMIRYHQPLENYLPASIVPLVREMTEKKEG